MKDLARSPAPMAASSASRRLIPSMMTALLLYAHCSGIYSSRRIAKACGERVDFMSIVGLDVPDFRNISEFRKRRLRQGWRVQIPIAA